MHVEAEMFVAQKEMRMKNSMGRHLQSVTPRRLAHASILSHCSKRSKHSTLDPELQRKNGRIQDTENSPNTGRGSPQRVQAKDEPTQKAKFFSRPSRMRLTEQ